jgi:hypothetical protein
MITADKLALLTNMPAVMLTTGIQAAGYKKDKFTKAQVPGHNQCWTVLLHCYLH